MRNDLYREGDIKMHQLAILPAFVVESTNCTFRMCICFCKSHFIEESLDFEHFGVLESLTVYLVPYRSSRYMQKAL